MGRGGSYIPPLECAGRDILKRKAQDPQSVQALDFDSNVVLLGFRDCDLRQERGVEVLIVHGHGMRQLGRDGDGGQFS